MIRWLDAIWGIASVDTAVGGSYGLAASARSGPRPISRQASELIRQRLAGGAVRCLARQGWRSEAFLRDGSRVAGRLWERHSPDRIGLTFTDASLQFLDWLASWPWQAGASPPLSRSRLSIGDRFFLLAAFEALRHTALGAELAAQPVFQTDGLILIAFPDVTPPTGSAASADFRVWLQPESAWILEALQPQLAARWETNERALHQITDPEVLADRSDSWSFRIESFLNALEAAGRLDLARFLLIAMHRQIRRLPRFEDSSPRFDRSTRDRRQLAVRESIAARFRPLQRLKEWEQRARATGYFDEGYAAAQLWLTEWERLEGDRLVAHAQELLAERRKPSNVS